MREVDFCRSFKPEFPIFPGSGLVPLGSFRLLLLSFGVERLIIGAFYREPP